MLLLASCQQTWMTFTIAVCTVKNTWWWTEELSETCRAPFQNKFEKLVHLVGFIIRNLSRCTFTWTSNGINIKRIEWDLYSTDTKCSYAAINISSKAKTETLKYFKPLKPTGHYMYHHVYHSQILPLAHTVYLCSVWISEQTAIISLYIINWPIFTTETECVYCAVRTGSLNIIDWFVFITETDCVYCAVRTGSLNIIDWLVFITETECVYCAVRTGSLNILDWLVFITEIKSVYCAVRTGYLKIFQVNFHLEHVNVIYMFVLPCILRNHNRSVVPTFSQINSVRSLPNNFFETHFNIIFTLTSTSLQFSLPFWISTKTSH